MKANNFNQSFSKPWIHHRHRLIQKWECFISYVSQCVQSLFERRLVSNLWWCTLKPLTFTDVIYERAPAKTLRRANLMWDLGIPGKIGKIILQLHCTNCTQKSQHVACPAIHLYRISLKIIIKQKYILFTRYNTQSTHKIF